MIAAGCIVSLRSIRSFPNFSATDEAMIFNYVDTFERTGNIEASLIPYPAPIVTGNLYIYAAALWTKLFPGRSVRAAEFLGARRLRADRGRVSGRRAPCAIALTGWIAAALLATNLLWMAVAHVGRQEIWLAVFVWAAVWLSLEARKRESGWWRCWRA